MKFNHTAWREFWSVRPPREKILWLALSLMLSFGVLYGVFWAPAAAHRARLSVEIPRLQDELAQMKQQAEEVHRLTRVASSAARSGEALKAALMTSLSADGFDDAKISNVQGGVRIQLSAALFSNWVRWLERARKHYKVRVVNAQIKALAQEGRVEVDAVLQTPP